MSEESKCWLYSPDCPEGKVFEDADAIAAAIESGWVDSPAKVSAPEPAPTKGKGGGKKRATADDDSE